jgi:hypothetical protein
LGLTFDAELKIIEGGITEGLSGCFETVRGYGKGHEGGYVLVGVIAKFVRDEDLFWADVEHLLGHDDVRLTFHEDDAASGDGGGTVVGVKWQGCKESGDGQKMGSAHGRFLHEKTPTC